MDDTPTGIVTFLFTDIEGPTALHDNYHTTQMRAALEHHDEIFRSNVEAKEGYVFATGDDAFSAAFNTPIEALEAVLAIQRALLAEEWPENVEVRARMGLHSGRAEERDGDGPQWSRAADLMSAGHGGQVLLSDATYNLVREELVHLEPEAELRYLGEHRLKGQRHTEHIFQLVVPDLPKDFKPLKTHELVTPPEPVNLDRRYGHVRRIGEGGMGDVYLVHEALDKDVALKVMKEQFAKDERFVKLFRREATITANLSHPNIVTVNDAGEGIFKGRKVFYIAMEYISGGTLRERIEQQEGPLSPLVAVEHAMRVAEALKAAHQSGLIHRDIKPENILLTESGEAKVADFGIAKAAATVATSKSLLLGTPHYISPEQAEGEPATFRSDLYSLGIVFYEMLTGKVPYDAESAWGVVSKHIRGQPCLPKEENSNVPEGINAVCVRLLAREPNQRYPDAATLIEDLKRVKDNPDAVVDSMRPTTLLPGRVRGDTVSMPVEAPDPTRQTLSWAERSMEEGPLQPRSRWRQTPRSRRGQTLSWADRLAELYAQARRLLTGPPTSLEDRLAELYARAYRLHRAQEWQAVVDVFYQIDALDSAYPDPKGLLVSAREELAALKLARIYGQGRHYMETEEWQQALECFEEVQRLKPGYQETERLLPQVREGLAAQKLERRVTPIYDQGRQHMEAEEWQQALECFEEVQRLKPGYQETEKRLSQVRYELISGITPSNVGQLQLLRTLEGHTGNVNSMAFSPDGRLLASGAGDATVLLWQAEDGELLHTLGGAENMGNVNSVAFSSDGRMLASGSEDKTVRLWRVEDGSLLRTLDVWHTEGVLSVAFSPDGQMLASAGRDSTMRLWRMEDGALLSTLDLRYIERRVSSVAFSSDGQMLASSSDVNTVLFW